jgi:heme-degrading monooxygenase HmoA
MVKEVSLLLIDPRQAQAFEDTYRQVAPVLRRQPGYHGDELLRVLENPAEYLLIIRWDRKEDHLNFVNSPEFRLLADPWGPFQKQAVVRHGATVAGSEGAGG